MLLYLHQNTQISGGVEVFIGCGDYCIVLKFVDAFQWIV